jgi:glucokinase
MPSAVAPKLIYPEGPRLLADIGGTYARFALEFAPQSPQHIHVFACAEFIDLRSCIHAYLRRVGLERVQHGVLAIANPITGDLVQMTNHHWCFSIADTRQALGLKTLLVANDFTALAMSLPYLKSDQRLQIGPGEPLLCGTMGLIGAGTGLGVSGLIYDDNHQTWVALNSEGGHQSFAPHDHLEAQILQWMWQKYPHVSAERLVSGSGIVCLHRALSEIMGLATAPLSAQEIVECAGHGDRLCLEVLRVFAQMLGNIAGNTALVLGSVGGMYIGGGIVQQMGNLFDAVRFRERFSAKGRFAAFLSRIPTYLITAPYPAFLGASAMLEAHLNSYPFA